MSTQNYVTFYQSTHKLWEISMHQPRSLKSERLSDRLRDSTRCCLDKKWAIHDIHNLEVVKLLQGDPVGTHHFSSLICACQALLSEKWCCKIQHVYRKANQAAHQMVRMGRLDTQAITIYSEPPVSVNFVLYGDCTDAYCTWTVILTD